MLTSLLCSPLFSFHFVYIYRKSLNIKVKACNIFKYVDLFVGSERQRERLICIFPPFLHWNPLLQFPLLWLHDIVRLWILPLPLHNSLLFPFLATFLLISNNYCAPELDPQFTTYLTFYIL